ncbi:MAG TPA: sigma-70 family RNA polymerase sigma factor, partial [Phaeodactylibacter sp.]|nr:sigma-70 family RNA polymerase sigma factor [Phaeodactylibacter sp.]
RKAVANKAIDYIRAQRMDFEEEVSSQEIVSPSSTQAMEYDELKDFIHHTAEGLPDRCRTVFFMSRFEEMSHKEIAAALGISEKTVENQITKALKVLRQAIRQYMSMDKMQVLLFFLLFA